MEKIAEIIEVLTTAANELDSAGHARLADGLDATAQHLMKTAGLCDFIDKIFDTSRVPSLTIRPHAQKANKFVEDARAFWEELRARILRGETLPAAGQLAWELASRTDFGTVSPHAENAIKAIRDSLTDYLSRGRDASELASRLSRVFPVYDAAQKVAPPSAETPAPHLFKDKQKAIQEFCDKNHITDKFTIFLQEKLPEEVNRAASTKRRW